MNIYATLRFFAPLALAFLFAWAGYGMLTVAENAANVHNSRSAHAEMMINN